MTDEAAAERVDRLLDAIDLIKAGERSQALTILRELIRENADFEEAWLWMSVAVDSLDQSSICLDNVLRINPGNAAAAGALYRLRASAIEAEKRRGLLRFWRDSAVGCFWLLVVGLLFGFLCSFFSGAWWVLDARLAVTLTP